MPKWTWGLLALAAGLLALVGLYAFVEHRSQAVLAASHPMPASAVHASTRPAEITYGAHLVQVADCAGCHGADLAGRSLSVSGSVVDAPNLTIASRRLSDQQLDAAIRRGLRPDGTSELAMPSQAFARLTDDETAAILGYLRSLPTKGALASQPVPGFMLRANLLLGVFRTEPQKLAAAKSPVDAGPAVASGRHLASFACAQCHGADLGGGHGAPGPDLTVRGYYDRAQFHTLMRTGVSPGDRDLELMARTARMSFSHFSDAEIDQVFDYLTARDRILASKPAGG